MTEAINDFNSKHYIEYFGKVNINDFSFTSCQYTKAKKTCSYYAAVCKDSSSDKKSISFVKLEIFATNGTRAIYIGKLLLDKGPVYINDIHNVEVEHIRHFDESNEKIWGSVEDLWKPLVKLDETKFCLPPKIWSAKL